MVAAPIVAARSPCRAWRRSPGRVSASIARSWPRRACWRRKRASRASAARGMTTDPLHRLLDSVRGDGAPQVFLVQGDLVLAEPAAAKVAEALAAKHGGRAESYRRPLSLAPLLQDLRTFSLFGAPKVVLAVDTAAFADRSAAADLVDDAEEALPLPGGGAEARSLSPRERQAASRLLQALKLFEIDAASGSAEQALEQLPGWALEGGKSARRGRGGRARGKRQVEELRAGLVALLDAARRETI